LLGSFSITLCLAVSLAVAPQAVRAASAQPTALHFVGTVLQGADAGVRLEGVLSLSPGAGTAVSGSLATFAGTIMNTRSGYTPIAVSGTMRGSAVSLSFDLSAGAMSGMSDADEAMGPAMKLAMPAFKHLGAHAAVRVTGHSFASGDWAGTLTGPAGGDTGYWMATPATPHTFDFNAVSKTGMATSLSGQAAVVFEVSGTVEGLYISDSGKQAYPLHGVVSGNQLSVVLEMGNGTFLYGAGAAGNVDTFQYFTGTFFGPDTTTSGKWSALFTS
jgi:hypothetical protein